MTLKSAERSANFASTADPSAPVRVTESPDDEFYEEADRRGLLIWQDFTDLPLDPGFIHPDVCREESADIMAG